MRVPERDKERAARAQILMRKVKAGIKPSERFVIVLVDAEYPLDRPSIISNLEFDEAIQQLDRAAEAMKTGEGTTHDVPEDH